MKILYTCFKGKYNASFQLVSEICGVKLYLTNSCDGLKRDIANQSEEYDFVIIFGIDKNLKMLYELNVLLSMMEWWREQKLM